jgi:hypothetical protein
VTRSGRGVAALGIALACTPAAPLAGQATATLDVGGSTVRYEGFLASGAFFVSPAARLDLTGASLAAQGTYLVFESGNRILQGTAAAAWIPAVREAIRPEFGGSAGISSYTGAPDAGHVLGRLRFHVGPGDRGVWLGGAIGRSFLGAASYGSSELGTGAWIVLDWLGLAVGGTYSRAGDTSFVDATANALWRLRWIQVDGLIGARASVGQGGGGEGVYGEVSSRIRLAGPLELMVSAGRYPSDPVRGALAGRFATVGVRLSARPLRRRASAALVDLLRREPRASEPIAPPGAPQLTLGEAGAGMRLLRIRAAGATFVEIAADFTDWEPVSLQRVDADDWEIVLPIARGAHRANVRVDGGPWLVPRGTRLERDEYGGEVGVVVVW